MDSLLDIGVSLAVTRRASGLSQRELAEAVGTSQQQIARWEATSYRSASLEHVAEVADALGVGRDIPTLAAETGIAYRSTPAPTHARAYPHESHPPVRDLGEIAARLRAHRSTLKEQYGLERIGVFGSFATGEQDGASDIDLLVEASEPGGLRFVAAAVYCSGVLGREVDFVRPHLLRHPFRKRVLSEVVYVWEA